MIKERKSGRDLFRQSRLVGVGSVGKELTDEGILLIAHVVAEVSRELIHLEAKNLHPISSPGDHVHAQVVGVVLR